MKKGFSNAIKIFKIAADRVPAYKDFLKSNKINATKVKVYSDFQSLPLVTKENYLKKYPFESLFVDAKLPPITSMSSGSSGEPFFWPRNFSLEKEGGLIHSNIFFNAFGLNPRKKTLIIVCFSMGTWVAGTYTLSSCIELAKRNKNLSIITPGIEKKDVILCIKNYTKFFDQIILAGYPPFLMDVLIVLNKEGHEFNEKYRILTAGENFTEEWRDSILKRIGVDRNLGFNKLLSIYGTADAALLGHEIPYTVSLRKELNNSLEKLNQILKNVNFLPTIVKYYPQYKFFESVDDKLVFTSHPGMPLIRYQIGDKGEVTTIKKLREKIDFYSNSKTKIFNKFSDKENILVLKGRDDIAVSFYAVNIYPENIRYALGKIKKINQFLTGKFVARVSYNSTQTKQIFNIELQVNKEIKLSKKTKLEIAKKMSYYISMVNSEYCKLEKVLGKEALPGIKFIRESKMFNYTGPKFKWVVK